MTAKVDIHVRHPAHVPAANYPPSLVLLVPSTDTAAGWLQHRRGGALLEDVLADEELWA